MAALGDPRQENFCANVVAGMSTSEAYKQAGYTHNPSKYCYQLIKKPHIVGRLEELKKEKAYLNALVRKDSVARLTTDKAWVQLCLREIADRCMQAIPVRDDKGAETGYWKFDAGNAIKAVELIGKSLGMFVSRSEAGKPGEFAHKTADELEQFIVQQLVDTGLARREAQQIVAGLGGVPRIPAPKAP